jgi:hypothetical protein
VIVPIGYTCCAYLYDNHTMFTSAVTTPYAQEVNTVGMQRDFSLDLQSALAMPILQARSYGDIDGLGMRGAIAESDGIHCQGHDYDGR